MTSLYDFPEIYDAVMDRPRSVIHAEVQSIRALLARRNRSRGSVLELACGACAHGIPLAQQGFSVTGIDRAAAMLAEAERSAQAAGVRVTLVQADVVDFALDQNQFDCAIFMFETFELITDHANLVRHFQAVGRHVRPGGIYIIDLHANRHGVGTATGEWGHREESIAGGHMEIWHEDFPGDWVHGTGHMALHCRIVRDGTCHETVDDWHYRVYSPWSLSLLVETLEGWRLDGFYSWRDLNPDISNEEHYFMVLERSEST